LFFSYLIFFTSIMTASNFVVLQIGSGALVIGALIIPLILVFSNATKP